MKFKDVDISLLAIKALESHRLQATTSPWALPFYQSGRAIIRPPMMSDIPITPIKVEVMKKVEVVREEEAVVARQEVEEEKAEEEEEKVEELEEEKTQEEEEEKSHSIRWGSCCDGSAWKNGSSHVHNLDSRSVKKAARGAVLESLPLGTSAIELAEIGVKLTLSKSAELKDIGLTGSLLRRKLFLPSLRLNENTACWLVNMAAFEACAALSDDECTVGSYLALFAMLMHREEDVHKLRARHLILGEFTNKQSSRRSTSSTAATRAAFARATTSMPSYDGLRGTSRNGGDRSPSIKSSTTTPRPSPRCCPSWPCSPESAKH